MKKLLSLILLTIVLFSNSLCTSAANVYTEDNTVDIPVTVIVEPSWVLTLPATVALTRSQTDYDVYDYQYTINCYGEVAENYGVRVVPDSTFVLSGTNTQTQVTANITQSKQYFITTDPDSTILPTEDNTYVYIAEDTNYTETRGTIKGKVSAQFTESDSYFGTFNFNFGYTRLP